MIYKFEPWNMKHDVIKPNFLNIENPPCKHCKYWSPQATYSQTVNGLEFDSVRLCWASDFDGHMEADFSCYTPKEYN